MQPRTRNRHMVILGVSAWLAAGVMVAAAALLVVNEPVKPVLDARGCPVGQAPSHHLQILVDGTDPLTAEQLAFANEALRAQITALPDGSLVEAYHLGEGDPRLWTPVAARCLPRKGGATANSLIENPRLIEKRYKKEIEAILRDSLDNQLQDPDAPSPLLVAIHELATRFEPEAVKQLVILSDLLERSPALNQYQDTRPFEAVRGDLPVDLLSPVLADVEEVSVLYLYRVSRRSQQLIQLPAHRRFWIDALTELGTGSLTWTDQAEHLRQHPELTSHKPSH